MESKTCCRDCYKRFQNNGNLNVKCMDCKNYICIDCIIDVDLLNPTKCRRCEIRWVIKKLINLHESINYLNSDLRALKKKEEEMRYNSSDESVDNSDDE